MTQKTSLTTSKERVEALIRKYRGLAHPELERYSKCKRIFVYWVSFYEARWGLISWQEYQRIHKFKEINYGVKAAEWRMLDYGNPAWRPVGYKLWGSNLS